MSWQDACAFMRANGVKRLKTAEFEIELGPIASLAIPDAPTPAQRPGVEHGGEPTQEQLEVWSAGGDLPPAEGEERR